MVEGWWSDGRGGGVLVEGWWRDGGGLALQETTGEGTSLLKLYSTWVQYYQLWYLAQYIYYLYLKVLYNCTKYV